MNGLSYIALIASVFAGCADEGAARVAELEGAITVRVSTALLHDVPTAAHYRVTAFDGAGTIVDQQLVEVPVDDVGELTLSCDRDAPRTRVQIAFEGLSDELGALVPRRDFEGPTEPVTAMLECGAGGLVATTFPFTRPSLRDDQDYTDDFIDLEARSCTAAFSLRELIVTPGPGVHDATAVVSFGCFDGASRPMVLWMDQVTIDCADGARVEPLSVHVERDIHDVNVASFSWTTASRLESAALAAHGECVLHARASANDPTRTTLGPGRSRWPAYTWSIPLTHTSGELIPRYVSVADDTELLEERFLAPDYVFDDSWSP